MRKMNGAAAVALTLALGAFGIGTAFADSGSSNNGSSGAVGATPLSTPIDNGGTLNQNGTSGSTDTTKDNDNTGIENQSGRDTSTMATSNPCSQFNGIQNQSGTDINSGSSTSTGSSSASASQSFQAYTVDKVTSKKITLRPFNSGSSTSSSNVQLQSGREVVLPLHKFQTLVNQNGTATGGMSGTSSSSSTGETGSTGTTGSTGSDYGATGSTSSTTKSSTGYGTKGTTGATASGSVSANASITPKVGDTVCVAMGSSNQPKAIQLLNGSSKLDQSQGSTGTGDQGTMNNDPSGTSNGAATPAPSPATGSNPSGSTP